MESIFGFREPVRHKLQPSIVLLLSALLSAYFMESVIIGAGILTFWRKVWVCAYCVPRKNNKLNRIFFGAAKCESKTSANSSQMEIRLRDWNSNSIYLSTSKRSTQLSPHLWKIQIYSFGLCAANLFSGGAVEFSILTPPPTLALAACT